LSNDTDELTLDEVGGAEGAPLGILLGSAADAAGGALVGFVGVSLLTRFYDITIIRASSISLPALALASRRSRTQLGCRIRSRRVEPLTLLLSHGASIRFSSSPRAGSPGAISLPFPLGF
jgi:hypothetical protein